MTKTIEIWNGQTPINGISADEILANRNDLKNALGDIFLVKQGEQVCEIQIGKIISANYEMEAGLSIEEIAQAYMVKKEEEAAASTLERMTNEELQEEVAILSYEVMMLQESLTMTMTEEEHSPKFNLIRRWYNRGFWTVEMVNNAVSKGIITLEEVSQIIN